MIQTQAISYGTLQLQLTGGVGFNARAEYDSTGNTLTGMRLTFRGKCIVAANDATPQTFNNSLQQFIQAFCLTQQEFKWTTGGVVQFDVVPASSGATNGGNGGAYTDRRFGPKPRITGIKNIPGGVSATVEWEIECFVYGCASVPSDAEEVWWQFSYDFDESFNCTRTVNGRYRVRSPINAASLLPNGTYFPPCPNNFKRKFSHRLSPDGLVLDFTCVDRQVWRTLPAPLTEGDAQMVITTDMAGRPIKQMSGWFAAPADVDKKVILQFIAALIRARFADALDATIEYFTSLRFEDQLFKNRVSFQVSSIRNSNNWDMQDTTSSTTQSIIASIFGDVATVQPADGDSWTPSNGQSAQRGMLGTTGLLPQPSAPFNLCGNTSTAAGSPGQDAWQAINTSPGTENSSPPGSGSTTNVTGTYTGSPPGSFSDSSTYTSDDGGNPLPTNPQVNQVEYMYPVTFYEERYQYLVNYNLVVLPVPITDATNGTPTPDIIQQVAKPMMRIIQAGSARRLGSSVDIPMPLYVDNATGGSTPGAYLAQQNVNTGTPQLMPDGRSIEYSASWSYEILSPANRGIDFDLTGSTTLTKLRAPVNPILNPSLYGGGDEGQPPDVPEINKYFTTPPQPDSELDDPDPQPDPTDTTGAYTDQTWDQNYYSQG